MWRLGSSVLFIQHSFGAYLSHVLKACKFLATVIPIFHVLYREIVYWRIQALNNLSLLLYHNEQETQNTKKRYL
jgi:hypothetical protein